MAYDPIRDEMSLVKRVAQLKGQGTPPGGYDPNLNTLRNTVGSVSSWITQGDPKGNLALPQFAHWEAPVRQALQEAQSGTLEQQFSAGPRFTPPPTPAPTPTPLALQPTAQIAQPQAPQQPQFQQGGTIVGIGAPQYGQTQQQQGQTLQPLPPGHGLSPEEAMAKAAQQQFVPQGAQPPARWNFNQQAGKWEQIGQQQTTPVAPAAPPTPPTPPISQTTPTSSYEEELRRLQESYAGPAKTPEQTESEKRLNDYLAQLDALEAQKRTEQARTGMEPVAMPFITGRQEAIERMASTRAGEIGAKAAPLQRQLAQMQTERESQRQAALDISKIRLERIQEQEKQTRAEQLEKQKLQLEQEKETKKSAIEQKETVRKQDETMALKGYRTINPADVTLLREKGMDVAVIGGRAYAKEPEGQKLDTQIVQIGKQNVLVNKNTGETIKVLGPTASAAGGGGNTIKGVQFGQDDVQRLTASGLTKAQIQGLQNDINQYGTDSVLGDGSGLKPEQKKAIQNVLGGVTPTQEQAQAEEGKQFLTKDYFQKVLTREQIIQGAKDTGFAHWWSNRDDEIKAYLDYLEGLIKEYRTAGYTDKEILKMMQ